MSYPLLTMIQKLTIHTENMLINDMLTKIKKDFFFIIPITFFYNLDTQITKVKL